MTKEEYANLLNVVQEEAGISYSEAREVVSIVRMKAQRLNKIAERQCNGYPVFENGRFMLGWDPVAAKKDEDREAKIEQELAALGNKYGLTFDTSGDPRGYVVKMKTPKTGKYNTWGGASEGWGIE